MPDPRSLAPAAIASFDAVFAALPNAANPVLLEHVRRRVATLLGANGDELPTLASDPTAADLTDDDQGCLEIAEQFVVDVAGISNDDRASLGAVLGANTFGFVQGLYVIDHGTRLVVALRQIFGESPFSALTADSAGDLWPALEAMMTAVVCLDALDPLTSELVRLRGANAHGCRLCQSRRQASVVASPGGALLEQVEAFEHSDLSDAHKAALRLTDAVLWQVGEIPPGVIADARRHFSEAAVLEIILDVARNASNKIAVALGADQPTVAEGVEYFEVNAVGAYEYGLPAPATSNR